jgi:hypothetical protein
MDNNVVPDGPPSGDNRIVHGLWIGTKLSRLELLTIHSFLRHNHEFHLWLYEDLETPLPREVVLEDAEKIIPRAKIFRKRDTDEEAGVGRQSAGSPFSNLFRYKLLYERGGYWVDMDVTCLRPFNFPAEYVFLTHRVGVVGNIMKCPARNELMKLTYEQVEREANEHSAWYMAKRVLAQNIQRLRLSHFIRPNTCNAYSWSHAIQPLIEQDNALPDSWFAIHWMNEVWRTLAVDRGYYKGRRLLDYVPDKG